MICVLALLLAVAVRITGPLPPRYVGPVVARRLIAAALDDRSWRAGVLAERAAGYITLLDSMAMREQYAAIDNRASRMHERLYQPAWTGLVTPAKPWAVWPTYMGQPHRVPGATLDNLIGAAA